MGAKGDQAKGQGKEVVGKVVGDKDLEAEGKADRRAGEAKEKVEDMKGFVEHVVDKTKDTAEDIVDKVKDSTNRK